MTSGGLAGRVLFVDLTSGRLDEERLPEQIERAFVGGQGIGVRVIHELMRPRVDPLGPESILGFVTGRLTGTPVPGSGRYMVVGKSPLTGTWAEANSGGTFGPAMKESGYDAIFFAGVAPEPVYLSVRHGVAALHPAAGLWGLDTYQTDDAVRAELQDPSLVVACIGPAGEARSLLAGIVNEKGRIAARSGLGAVMGAKRLKAVAVKAGFRKIPIGSPDRLREARQRYLDIMRRSEFQRNLRSGGTAGGTSFLVSIGDSPIRNWRETGLDAMPGVTRLDSGNLARYKRRAYACRTCPVACGAILEQPDGPYGIQGHMHRPEYETTAAFGGMLVNDHPEAVLRATDLCNRYGIDTMNTGGTIAFAMECFERGVIDAGDTDGLDLTWGNAEAVVALTGRIARREGFGAVLADGVAKAAERIGCGSEEWAMGILGQSLAYHDPRMSPALATAMTCDANPAHHMDCGITAQLEAGVNVGDDPALQVPALDQFADFERKGPTHAVGAKFHQLFNAAGLCALYTIGSTVPLAELIAGVTGWDFGWPDALEVGHRILTLRQAFNVREGVTPDMVRLPRRIRDETLQVGPCAGLRTDFDALRRGYFEAMGWDPLSGHPSPAVLERLSLGRLVPGPGNCDQLPFSENQLRRPRV